MICLYKILTEKYTLHVHSLYGTYSYYCTVYMMRKLGKPNQNHSAYNIQRSETVINVTFTQYVSSLETMYSHTTYACILYMYGLCAYMSHKTQKTSSKTTPINRKC